MEKSALPPTPEGVGFLAEKVCDNSYNPREKNIDEKEFKELLMKWYKKNGYNFPWRNIETSPFINLVCELMLQRTTTAAVEKFYPTIIEKYSKPKYILKTSDKELKNDLRFLGLQNKRTKTLKQLADSIITKYDRKVPKNEEELKSIKGIGKYTARAVLCFSFNRRLAIVDSNIRRIIKRVFDLKNKNDKYIRKIIDEILPKNNYRKFNYALLDLGSIICTPKNPDCRNCPINRYCSFYMNKSNKE
ncbi:MAG: hypothetical protein GF329_04655 [Candidatus Lokiarchaeota archaeon]|nr:hypothetical protein [Candidatus Lokiarchaeota archaeon]